MIIEKQLLNNEHKNAIKPIHSKIKGVLKAFDKANDAMDLTKLITAPLKFEEHYKKLKEEMEYAQKTTAVQLGLCRPFFFVKFVFQTKTGCHVLYKKFPEMVTAKERRDALSELNTQWRDSGATKLVPEYLRKHLKDAAGTK